MGMYVNPGNEGFQRIVAGEYVDKTGLIALVNAVIGTRGNLVCVTRPRRFGNSLAAIEAFNQLPEVEAELVRLDERLKWVGIQKADELLSAIRERMIPLEEEKNPTDDQRRELEELHGQWAEASAQRAIYADKEVQIRACSNGVLP